MQFVIRDTMDEETQHLWAERAIRMVDQAFPDKINDVKTWEQCRRYLPHALACAKLVDQYALASPEAARLFNQVGYYLREQARYPEAEAFLRQALVVREQVQGPKHPDTAESLNNLARLYFDQYKYAEAAPFYEQAQQIRLRPRLAAHLITNYALRCNTIALLASERPVSSTERNATDTYAPDAETEFDLLNRGAEIEFNIAPSFTEERYEATKPNRSWIIRRYAKVDSLPPILSMNANRVLRS